MSDKAKHKHGPDRWWRFPRHFSYEGDGSIESFASILQSFRYEMYGKTFYSRIDEIVAGEEYQFLLVLPLDIKREREDVALRGHISTLSSGRFVVEGTSIIPSAGFAPIRDYSVQWGCIALVLGPLILFKVPLFGAILALLFVGSYVPLFLSPFADRGRFLNRLKRAIDDYSYVSPTQTVAKLPSQSHEMGLSNEGVLIYLYSGQVAKKEKRS